MSVGSGILLYCCPMSECVGERKLLKGKGERKGKVKVDMGNKRKKR